MSLGISNLQSASSNPPKRYEKYHRPEKKSPEIPHPILRGLLAGLIVIGIIWGGLWFLTGGFTGVRQFRRKPGSIAIQILPPATADQTSVTNDNSRL